MTDTKSISSQKSFASSKKSITIALPPNGSQASENRSLVSQKSLNQSQKYQMSGLNQVKDFKETLSLQGSIKSNRSQRSTGKRSEAGVCLGDIGGDLCDGTETNQTVHYLSDASSVTHDDANEEFSLDDSVEEEHDLKVWTSSEVLARLNVDQRTADRAHFSEESIQISNVERTLAIIKPSLIKYQVAIERRIADEGFVILAKRKIHLSPEQAAEFYSHLYGTMNFPSLIVYMSSGPIWVYCLAKPGAIKAWREVIGPTSVRQAEMYWPRSLRGKYGRFDPMENGFHGSSDADAARKEIQFFFPEMMIEPLAVQGNAVTYLNNAINSVLSQGLAELCRVKPVDPIVWLADWLLLNNPYRPRLPEILARTIT